MHRVQRRIDDFPWELDAGSPELALRSGDVCFREPVAPPAGIAVTQRPISVDSPFVVVDDHHWSIARWLGRADDLFGFLREIRKTEACAAIALQAFLFNRDRALFLDPRATAEDAPLAVQPPANVIEPHERPGSGWCAGISEPNALRSVHLPNRRRSGIALNHRKALVARLT